MKKILFIPTIFLCAGCASTYSNRSLSNGQFVASFTDKQVGADGTSVVDKIMVVAAEQCGAKKIKVMKLDNSGFTIGSFPRATLIYECE